MGCARPKNRGHCRRSLSTADELRRLDINSIEEPWLKGKTRWKKMSWMKDELEEEKPTKIAQPILEKLNSSIDDAPCSWDEVSKALEDLKPTLQNPPPLKSPKKPLLALPALPLPGRKTADLEPHWVVFDERDVALHGEFRQELKELLGEDASVPRLFVKGRYIGGVEEVVNLMRIKWLGRILNWAKVERGVGRLGCEGCGGVRFVPCFDCGGSCKVVNEDVKERCPKCNENVKCSTTELRTPSLVQLTLDRNCV
ncbi:hypothetical protein HAX54_008940 [Datura stramonium]|uniref:Glutaredoxin domain-containing protein n=1 Tax=Datura stramonium TaxID=4076 RepID=A0ABS8RVP8_DATST|nr:hypothetical protein [Datura stramonium]